MAPSASWDPKLYKQDGAFVSKRGRTAARLLDARAGERVLDLGCGDGALTQVLLDAGAEVVGVDDSQGMVDAARALGIDARVMDMCALPFAAEFDAAFSNAALHWAHNPQAALAGVHRALRPGGRFVGEFGGCGNIAAIVGVLNALVRQHGLDPRLAGGWFFPSPRVFADMARKAGFTQVRARLVHRPTPLPKGLRGWLRVFRADLLIQAGSQAEALLDEAEACLAPALCRDGAWFADYVRLRFSARRV